MPDPFDDFFSGESSGAEEAEEVRVGHFEAVDAKAAVIPPLGLSRPSAKARQEDSRVRAVDSVKEVLREVEDSILKKSSLAIDAALDWAKVAELAEPPPEWVSEMGEAAARERFVIAKSACMRKSASPVGLDIAQRTMIGIVRARATERNNDKPLNVQILQISTTDLPLFPEVVETEGEGE